MSRRHIRCLLFGFYIAKKRKKRNRSQREFVVAKPAAYLDIPHWRLIDTSTAHKA